MSLKDAMGIVLDGARAMGAVSQGVTRDTFSVIYRISRVAYRLLEMGLTKEEVLERIEKVAPHKVSEIDRKIDEELEKLPR